MQGRCSNTWAHPPVVAQMPEQFSPDLIETEITIPWARFIRDNLVPFVYSYPQSVNILTTAGVVNENPCNLSSTNLHICN